LYLHGGQVVFEYNCGLVARYRVAATVPLGTRRLEAQFAYDGRDGKPAGAGGTLTLLADGRALATGRIEQTLTTMFSVTDGLDVGLDLGSPVSDAYEPPFRYTGQLDSVTIDLK
jgi:arylsulfatase